MNNTKKELENLKTEIAGLRIRLKRIEEYLQHFKNLEAYTNNDDGLDELFEQAKKIVVLYDRVTSSLLQRKFSVGYSRATRILDQLEAAGIVGQAEGAKPRDVLMRAEEINNSKKDKDDV